MQIHDGVSDRSLLYSTELDARDFNLRKFFSLDFEFLESVALFF